MTFKVAGAITDSASHLGTDNFNIAVPAVVDGDVLRMDAYRGNQNGDFVTPAGWTRVPALEVTRAAQDNLRTFVAVRAASSEPASYDLTHTEAANRTQSAVITAYEDIDIAIFDVTPIAAHAAVISDNNTPTNQPITTVNGNADVILTQWCSNAEITTAIAPTGYTLRVNHSPFNDRNLIIADKVQLAAGVVTPGPWLHTTSAQFGDGAVATMALKSIPITTLTADSIDTSPFYADDTAVIALSNADNAGGKTGSIPEGALTSPAQDISSYSLIVPDPKIFGDKKGVYNTDTTITVADGAETADIVFQISPTVGDEVGAVAALTGIYAEPEFAGLQVGDTYYTRSIPGADFTEGAVPKLPTEQVLELWIQVQGGNAWGDTPFTVTITASGVSVSGGIVSELTTNLTHDLTRNLS